jgi:hypothetical protein
MGQSIRMFTPKGHEPDFPGGLGRNFRQGLALDADDGAARQQGDGRDDLQRSHWTSPQTWEGHTPERRF